MKDFVILLEDDWELKGNGLGNVASHQYLPAKFLMETCEKLGIPMTFMVEAAQGFTFKDHRALSADIRLQDQLWSETVSNMLERGFDVQLHIHPQWHSATYEDGFFHLGRSWNIGTYDEAVQQELLRRGIDRLKESGAPSPIAFKGGSWGLQPSGSLLKALDREGVRLLLGMRDGLWIPDNNVDYRDMEEPFKPYFPDKDDIRKKGVQRDVLALPLQPHAPSFRVNGLLGVRAVRRKLFAGRKEQEWGMRDAPVSILQNSPLKDRSKFRFSFRPYLTHLKLGGVPFAFMKGAFEQCVKRLERIESDDGPLPIVIESHTKSFEGYYEDIERFLTYLKRSWGHRVSFMDLTTYYETISPFEG